MSGTKSFHSSYIRRILYFSLGCLILTALPAIAQNETSPTTQIDRVSIDEINLNFVQIAVYASVVSQTSVEIRELSFQNLRLNGMPVYAVPFIGNWHLPSNVRAPLPQPVGIRIYLRDLESTAPLEQLLSRNRVVLEGAARIKVGLNLTQQFFLRSRTATASLAFRTEVPVGIPAPGPVLGTAAAILGLGSPVLEGSRSGLDAARELVSRWRRDLRMNYLPLLVHVRSKFIIKNTKGKSTTITAEWNGVRISKSGFLIPLEALEPWTFDPELAAAIKAKSVSVVRGSSDLEVWPLVAAGGSADRPLKLSAGEVLQVRKGSVEKDSLIVQDDAGASMRVPVGRRLSAENVAYLEFADGSQFDGPLRFAPANSSSVARLATFRMYDENRANPELVFLDAAVSDDGIHLTDPIDSAATGSPLISTDGLVGFVVDENHGIRIQQALKTLKLEKLLKDVAH